jgi:regulatory protein
MSPPDTVLLEKARQFCDYQERCVDEVRQKLLQWHADPHLIDKIIIQLENENYLDEDRFVRNYALGKLRHNKWGRNKIIQGLRQKGVPELFIQIGLEEIDSEEYIQTLKEVLSAKRIKEEDPFKMKGKLAQYAIQKGFQSSLVWDVLNNKR